MNGRLKGRAVVVIGAASGIGAATARLLARALAVSPRLMAALYPWLDRAGRRGRQRYLTEHGHGIAAD